MASGLVVVSSGVGGAGELIDDGRTGLRFKAGDSQRLARCLMRLAQDTNLLNGLRQAGQQEGVATLQRDGISKAGSWIQAGCCPTNRKAFF